MPTVTDRAEFLRRWRASLSSLDPGPAAQGPEAAWYNVLYAKVLRYLIARYEDERGWNQYALKLPPAAKSPPGPGRAVGGRESAPPAAPVVSPPRSSQEMLPRLQSIRAANMESYRDFDLREE